MPALPDNLVVNKTAAEVLSIFVNMKDELGSETLASAVTVPSSASGNLLIDSVDVNTSSVAIQVGGVIKNHPTKTGVLVGFSAGLATESPYSITVRGTTSGSNTIEKCLTVKVDEDCTAIQDATSMTVIVKEDDNDPSVVAATLRFPNGSVSDAGGGVVDITFPTVSGLVPTRQLFTLDAGDISNKYITLPVTPTNAHRVVVTLRKGAPQVESLDWTFSSGTSRISWNGLTLDGQLQVDDVLEVWYLT